MACDLVYELQGQFPHIGRLKITYRVRQHDILVPFHPLAAELEVCCPLERGSDDGRRWDAPLLELHGVVHTAQRAGPSTAEA
ncbi:uncharacterized protein METZ01_LOCUS405433, partial [marine metagenome]